MTEKKTNKKLSFKINNRECCVEKDITEYMSDFFSDFLITEDHNGYQYTDGTEVIYPKYLKDAMKRISKEFPNKPKNILMFLISLEWDYMKKDEKVVPRTQ